MPPPPPPPLRSLPVAIDPCPSAQGPTAAAAALALITNTDGNLTRLASVLAPDSELFVTFGNSALAPFVSNLLSTLARHGVSNLLVGALDDGLYAACVAACVPAVRISDDDGTAASAATHSAYIRKDYGAFKRLGARKVGFLAHLLALLGDRVGMWVCDADAAFLRPPDPALLTTRSDLAQADVLLSTDCLDLAADARGACAGSASFNTGIVYLRARRPGARALVHAWRDRMEHVGPEPWLDDQAVRAPPIAAGLRACWPARMLACAHAGLRARVTAWRSHQRLTPLLRTLACAHV